MFEVDSVNPIDHQTLDSVSYLQEFSEKLGCSELHFRMDPDTGLVAVIAIHSLKLGPSLGGCRCVEYPNLGAAILDAMRLSRAMTYKSALAGLPHGGGKAVLYKPAHIKDRTAYLKTYGKFVNALGGRYITAKDSGIDMCDLDTILTETSYVAGYDKHDGTESDPSVYTAHGVLRGIQAAVKFKLKKDSLKGIHVAIQGTGAVGYNLTKLLAKEGAELTLCDIDTQHLNHTAKEFNAQIVSSDEILSVKCDVFAPCALGGVINSDTIPLLKTPIVAGGANNPLEDPIQHAEELKSRGILYAPDYVINAGGVIYAAASYDHQSEDKVYGKVDHLYDKLMTIFERAERENVSTIAIAGKMADEILASK